MGYWNVLEALESRRLLATTNVYSGALGYSYTPSGVTASWTVGADTSSHYSQGCGLLLNGSTVTADTYTLNLSGLPAHSMVLFQVDEEAGPWHADNGSGTLKVVAGNSTQTTSYSNYYNPYSYSRDYSANFGKWFANSGSSLSITLSAESMTANCGYFVPEVTVAIYQPTVTLGGGGGSTDEDNATPTGFNVSRDAPGGYQGTSYGDEGVPSTTVGLAAPTGSATEGSDYQTLSRSVTLPTATTASGVTSAVAIPVVPIDDPDAEGIEDIFLSLTQPQQTAPYQLAAVPATAPATNAATQKATIGDNVSVKDITLSLVTDDPVQHPTINLFSGYSFRVRFDITGENVQNLQYRQEINSSTAVTLANGTAATAQDLGDSFNSVKSNSNGWAIDVGPNGQQEWNNLLLKPDNASGAAFYFDDHAFTLNAAQVPYGNQNAMMTYLIHATRYLRISVRDGRPGRQGTILKTLDWGFKWSNWNTIWQAGDPNPLPAGAIKAACDKKGGGKGIFSDPQTITGLTF